MPQKKGDEKKSSPVRERSGVLPHFMRVTVASMAKQQPLVTYQTVLYLRAYPQFLSMLRKRRRLGRYLGEI